MAFIDPQPVTAASSEALTFTGIAKIANPFLESNCTWQELEGSVTEDWAGFDVVFHTRYAGVVQIATGAAASEVAIAVLPALDQGESTVRRIHVPIAISAGTRLSASYVSVTTREIRIQVQGFPATEFPASPTFTKLDAGPFNLDTVSADYGRLVQVDPGGTINTKSGYVEISQSGTNSGNNVLNGDSLPNSYDYFGLFYETEGQSGSGANFLFDVAHGAAASEVDFFSGGMGLGRPFRFGHGDKFLPFGRASGDRISIRAQSDNATVGEREVWFGLYGLR